MQHNPPPGGVTNQQVATARTGDVDVDGQIVDVEPEPELVRELVARFRQRVVLSWLGGAT